MKRFLASLIFGLSAIAAPAETRPPNVILIMADDLGYRDLGCYGHPSIKTPVLDKLAAGGARLTGFHAGASICTPSRMALLTGAYPVRLGWTQGVAGFKMGMRDGMSGDALTIAEIFSSAGYSTALSGKWHIGDSPETRPPAQGFGDAFYLTHSNNQVKAFHRGDAAADDPFDNRLLTEKFTNEAIRFVKENRDKPFLLYLPYTAPHFPVEAHPDWKGKSAFGAYGDVVEEMDARIGELLEVVRELGLEKDTLVVFTSDNGPQKGEQASAHPFRGMKWSPLEGGTRVPCIVSWPGKIPSGTESDMLIAAIDLLPTLSRACGIDWKSKSTGKPVIDGIDLWDSLLGKKDAPLRTELLHWHGMHPEPQAFRSSDWKLVLREDPKKETPPALYNLREDPSESKDLSAAKPELTATLTARAKEIMDKIKADGILPISKPK
jgi:arylsulfatase